MVTTGGGDAPFFMRNRQRALRGDQLGVRGREAPAFAGSGASQRVHRGGTGRAQGVHRLRTGG